MDRDQFSVICRFSFPWLALLAVSAAAATVDAYGRLPSIEQAALSPDGSKIAFVRTTQDLRVLAVVDVNEEKFVAGLRVGDVKVRSVEWADDDNLLVTTASSSMPIDLSGERREWHLMAVYNLKAKKMYGLLNHVRGGTQTMNTVFGAPVIQRQGNDTLLFLHGIYITDKTESALFRINLTNDTETLIKQGSDVTNEWLVDDTGAIVAEQDYTERDRRWAIRLFRDGHVQQTVSGIAAIDAPEMLGLSAAGDAIVVAQSEAGGITWKALSIKDGSWGPGIAENESLTNLVYKHGSWRMIGSAFVGDSTQYHFVDPAVQNGWDWIVRVFGYQRVEFVSASADYTKFIVQVLGAKSGYAYYLADTKEHLTRPIGKIYDDVEQIAEVRPIKYAAEDGLEIPAYLTLPPDRPAKNLPIIVFPHGGPEARDILAFDWWAQALAVQGYAVLQPNYRGSDLGKKWVESGYNQWGRKMQTDLSDGLHYLAAQGIADPKRACIVGASYGGYAALAGVAIQSGIYRCAVAVAGISDPSNFMRWVMRKEQYGSKVGLRYWERFLGVDNPGDKRLDEISPLRHADQITVPLLLIHGRDDTTASGNRPMTSIAKTASNFSCDGSLSRATSASRAITFQTLIGWLKRGAAGLRELAPYAAIELLLPGGSLMAMGLWLFRRKAKRKAFRPATVS